MKRVLYTILGLLLLTNLGVSQSNMGSENNGFFRFNFEGNVKSGILEFEGKDYHFVDGIDGQALSIQPDKNFNNLALDNLSIGESKDFTVQFWLQTYSNKPTVLISKKQFLDKSISSQKNKGWVLYTSGGTFAWSVGSGDRRLTYERDNGDKMPLTDGAWHQITMTYNKMLSEVRLYYDGQNKAIYKLGFDFFNDVPLVIGAKTNEFDYNGKLLPQIENGALQLQALLDEFNVLGIESVKNDEFIKFIVDPEKLLSRKRKDLDSVQFEQFMLKNSGHFKKLRNELLINPYTVFQNLELTELIPISKIYYLDNGKIIINTELAQSFTKQTQLFPSDFNMDNLSIWDKVLSAEDVFNSYVKYSNSPTLELPEKIESLNVGVWNIWHGGKHFTFEDDNWDSRIRIVEMIKEKKLDIILMQETYSSGDLIAAELGFYFATTFDGDYRFQGSNISVISRYPIKDLFVPMEATFMNVGVKLALSKTQDIYAMSNWYGMNSFPVVYDFHKDRFKKADVIPILFGGDFNAVPHNDGGESPASVKLLESGFIDAYRSLNPDVKNYPGYTHNTGVRIDQLYFKGKGLNNISTEVISEWPNGFPSDHFMIVSKFKLVY